MYIEKCDLCGTEIEKDGAIKIGYGKTFARFALCKECGAPVELFLKEHELIGAVK